MNDWIEVTPLDPLELFEQAPEAVLVVGAEGDVLLANRHCEVLFGYSADELCQLQVEALMPTRFRTAHLAARDAYRDHPRRLEMGSRGTLAGLRRDGSEFPAEISVSPLGRPPERYVVAVRDVSVRRRQEADRDFALRVLEAVAAAQAAFIGEHDPQALFAELLDRYLDLSASAAGLIAEVAWRGRAPRLRVRAAAGLGLGPDDTLAPGPEAWLAGALAGAGVITVGCGDEVAEWGLGAPGAIADMLCAPLGQDGAVTGVVLLADRAGGYPEELVTALGPLLQATATLLGRCGDAEPAPGD